MSSSSGNTAIHLGGGVGVSLAVVLSYAVNHHMGWAILHGILSWFYVIYRALGYGV